jgi:hypothetical protein
MDRMKHDSTTPDHGRTDDQQAKEEGAERLRRQQLWLRVYWKARLSRPML